MKTNFHSNSETDRNLRTPPTLVDSVCDRELLPGNGKSVASPPRRRYPSLSDDGRPWFPPYVVRAFAILAIIVIIVALATTK